MYIKINYSSNTKYNSKGRVIESNYPNGGQKINYNSDTIVTENIIFHHKKYSKTEYLIDNQTFITRETNNENKIIKECITKKNENGKPISSYTRFGKKMEFSTEVKLFYNSDGKIEKRQHFKNDILVQEWNYDCSKEGKLVKKENVFASSTCIWQDQKNDGSYTTYLREIKNGKSYLSKYEYSKDSVPLSVKIYLQDTILLTSSEKFGATEIVKHYNIKGKLIKLNTIISNNEGKQIFKQLTTFGITKHTSIWIYEYNSFGHMTKTTSLYNRNILNSKSYEYDEKGMLRTYTSTKNGELISTTEFEYIYNQ